MQSTKEVIKKVALSYFAEYGYAGTSMKNISEGVGITKASLYSHFKGKEEILFEVYGELSTEYIQLHNRLFEEAEKMDFRDKLEHLFQGYILYYYKNKEVQAFWQQVTLLSPPEIREVIIKDLAEIDEVIYQKMKEIFQAAMDQGVIKTDNPSKLVISFRAMRDGLLKWMMIIPKVNQELIPSFWSDFWFGLEVRDQSR